MLVLVLKKNNQTTNSAEVLYPLPPFQHNMNRHFTDAKYYIGRTTTELKQGAIMLVGSIRERIRTARPTIGDIGGTLRRMPRTIKQRVRRAQ